MEKLITKKYTNILNMISFYRNIERETTQNNEKSGMKINKQKTKYMMKDKKISEIEEAQRK